MANLKNLTDKIIADGETQAAAIVDKANSQAKEILDGALAMANEQGKLIEASAVDEARNASEMVMTQTRFEIRNKIIQAKLSAIDRAFGEVLANLKAMDKEAFASFVKAAVARDDPDQEEIILPEHYGFADAEWLNEDLKAKGLKGNLTLYKGDRKIDSGFILVKGGIEKNNTFESMLDYQRYDLENIVNETLFGKGGAAV